jgi:ABC-type nitrate/sulfonate/bicarbonate transport system substrate-binding protein
MINFLRNTVRIAFALPIALSFAIGAAQADKIKIALAETPSDELAAFFVALDRARANGLDYEWTAFSDEELSNPLRIQWLDLKAPVEDLNITLKDNISFFNAAIA